jgi:tetratricopeptide (TPR) repeat protein
MGHASVTNGEEGSMQRGLRQVAAAAAAGSFLFFTSGPLAAVPSPTPSTPPATGLGELDFPTSGAPGAQPAFLRGVLLLHSFEYEDAAAAFRQAQQADPGFAMAYWGEAMTCNHPIWQEQDPPAARAVLHRLGGTAAARLAKAPTAREKGYLEAVETLFSAAAEDAPGAAGGPAGEAGKPDRDRAYAEAMRRVHEAYPDDLEAASFYALALLGTAETGRDIPTYMRAAAVAEEVFSRNPSHPGAVHYLIHSYDDPVHAALGLRPARVYARIAPAAAHALHMPSHIFFALGMWDEAVAANEASWAAAEARRQRQGLPLEARGYHALAWLAYAYLQQGRHAEARSLLATMAADAHQSGSPRTRMHLAVMRAAHLIETRGGAADLPAADGSGLGLDPAAAGLFATAYAELRGGDAAAARRRLAELQALRQPGEPAGIGDAGRKAGGNYGANTGPTMHHTPQQGSAGVMEVELTALLDFAAGQRDEAVALASQAALAEDATSFEFGPPMVVKPAHELAGELLFELGRYAEARRHFEQALARAPGRALSLLGLARAAGHCGDAAAARQSREAYAELARNWRRADAGLPDLAEVRRNAATPLAAATPGTADDWPRSGESPANGAGFEAKGSLARR